MKKMNDIEVILNNKRYTLSGYESGEYLQKVASYINSKYYEFKSLEGYKIMDNDIKNILLDINIADDYFKAQKKAAELEEENERKSNELFDMKHDVISAQTKLESVQKELKNLQDSYNEAQKKIVKLETELEDIKK